MFGGVIGVFCHSADCIIRRWTTSGPLGGKGIVAKLANHMSMLRGFWVENSSIAVSLNSVQDVRWARKFRLTSHSSRSHTSQQHTTHRHIVPFSCPVLVPTTLSCNTILSRVGTDMTKIVFDSGCISMTWYGTGSLATCVVPLSTIDTLLTRGLYVCARQMSCLYRSRRRVAASRTGRMTTMQSTPEG